MLRTTPHFLWAALFALLSLAPLSAQPLEGPDGWRPPGTRTRTASEARRFHTGVDELQPKIPRPAGFRELNANQAAGLVAALRAELLTPRSVESLVAGLNDYRAVDGRLQAAVAKSGGALSMETIGKVHGLPVRAIHLAGAPGAEPKPKVILLGGVHSGTEKTGFEAATRYVEKLAADPSMRARFDITIVPLVSPTALVLGTRENAKEIDINRTFVEGKTTPESKVLVDFVRHKTFDFHLDLHTAGDPGRDGFFLIRGQKDGGLGARIMKALPSAALLDAPGKPGEARVGPYILYGVGLSEIESIRHTTMDLLARQGTPYVYTFEAPTRADPKVQVDLTLRMIDSALNNAHKHGEFPRLRRLARERAKSRAAELETQELAPGKTSSLDAYRRADGTLDWGKLTRAKALPEVAGLAHFGLALFLKEVAVVTATGDRVRIEEFFDGLLTTDFYKHYGLFVAGARIGELGYTRALQRFVKPGFVNSILKTNLVLAAGIALPQVVDGTFTGRGFAITLGSLGLSTAAVRAGVRGITWVSGLQAASSRGLLKRMGLTRLGKLGGWVYTAAELAVVLYFAEELEERVNAHFDLQAAREELQTSGRALVSAAADPHATPATLAEALKASGQAWADYRNFLYAPLQEQELFVAARLERQAAQAQVLANRRQATLDKVQGRAALRANVERRHGSVEAYAAARLREDEAEIQAKVDAILSTAAEEREALWRAVYEREEREGALLKDVGDLPWLLRGALPGAAGDPFGAREDAFARWGRERAKDKLSDALRDVSRNRLQTYQDERDLYQALKTSLADRPDLAKLVQAATERSERIAAADRNLSGLTKRTGINERLQGVGAPGPR